MNTEHGKQVEQGKQGEQVEQGKQGKQGKQGEQQRYLSYLMRVWRAPTDGGHAWRASLEEALTQEVHGFKDLQSLFAFLLAQTGQTDVKRET